MSLRNRWEEKAGRLLQSWPALLVVALLAAGGLFVAGCDDEPEGTLAFGDVCTADGDCVSGLCRNTDLNGPTKRCSATCDEATPCEFGTCGTANECVLGPAPIEEPAVGIIYVGPIGDHGWSKAHDDGRAYLASKMPDIDIEVAEAVIPPDAPAKIDEFIANGNNIIIGTSHDFLNSLQDAANANPDVMFLTCSGFETSANMGSYFGRMYQIMYLVGTVAGATTETGVIGVVGPVIIPETVRHINAFTLGVRAANPDAVVVIDWIGNWFSTGTPPEEQTAVETLVNTYHADIIFGHTDTPIPMATVVNLQDGDPTNGELGTGPDDPTFVYTLGYDNLDSCTFSPDYCLTSAGWNWGPIMVDIITQIQEGTYLPSNELWEQVTVDPGDRPSIANYAPINADLVDAATISGAASLFEDLATPGEAGLYLPWTGPINDAEGEERIAEGEHPTDEQLLSMCWYVEGVTDTDEEPTLVPSTCPGEF